MSSIPRTSDPLADDRLSTPERRATPAGWTGSPWTWANLVTLLRTTVAVVLGFHALTNQRPDVLVAAYAVYWVGDMLDGLMARTLKEETPLGAVFDIVSDRACTSVLCLALVLMKPELHVVVIGFFMLFMVLDTVLSLSFLCFGLKSPNDFWQADRTVHRLNWSPLAKGTNTAAVIVLALIGFTCAATTLVVGLALVKCWSGIRVLDLLETRRAAT